MRPEPIPLLKLYSHAQAMAYLEQRQCGRDWLRNWDGRAETLREHLLLDRSAAFWIVAHERDRQGLRQEVAVLGGEGGQVRLLLKQPNSPQTGLTPWLATADFLTQIQFFWAALEQHGALCVPAQLNARLDQLFGAGTLSRILTQSEIERSQQEQYRLQACLPAPAEGGRERL